jgi:DNA-binding NtrC family response regulator
LLRTGDPPSTCEAIRQSLAAAVETNDAHVASSLTMLYSEALAHAGDVIGAAKSLGSLVTNEVARLRDQRGDYYRAWAVVLEAAGDPLASRVGERALRVWSTNGDQCALAQAAQETHLGTARPAKPLDGTSSTTDQLPRHALARFVANSIASSIESCDDHVALGDELLKLLDALECTTRAELLDVSHRSPRVLSSVGVGKLDPLQSCEIEVSREKQIIVRCTAREDAGARMLVGNLSTIWRGIQGIKTQSVGTGNTALWPEEITEHVEGALFVSESMLTLLETGRRIAGPNITVLITGETGTGKEVLARVIHAASPRAHATFLPFNCAACPKDMVDAQLFGHRRGAFTGAVEHASGVIRAAAGGTLFFDEIGETPLEVQPKLLRFLESGDIHPIGEPHPIHVDVRVIAATNADLDAQVAAGRFRDDLFYRLNIVRLHLPPLRERRVEIPVFAQHYLTRYARELDKGDLRLAEETIEYLLLYKWPGNVRQLANEIRRMVALAERDAVLMPEHLSADIVASRRTVPASERILDPTEVVVRLDQPMAAAMRHLESAMLQYALKASGGHMEAAAKRLGLSRKGLYLKRQRFGLEPAAPPIRPA